MALPSGHWQPYVLPVHVPVPIQQPVELALTDPVLLDHELSTFLALGLGPLWGQRWSWHWAADGVLHLFDGDTEQLRARMRPMSLLPGAAWQVTSLVHSHVISAANALVLLQEVLDHAAAMRADLRGIPTDRAHAVAAGFLACPALPHPPDVIVENLAPRLPRAVTGLHLGDVVVPLPRTLVAAEAFADGSATLITFEDGARLWIYSARVSVDPMGLTAVAGGALLWPGAGWPLPAPVLSWGLVSPGRHSEHRLRGLRDQAVDISLFARAGDIGVSNIGLDVPLPGRGGR